MRKAVSRRMGRRWGMVLAAALCALATWVSAAAFWARLQNHLAYSYDGWAMAGEWDYRSSTWITSQGGGFGPLSFEYDTYYYPDRWYGLILYDYGSGAFSDVHAVYTP